MNKTVLTQLQALLGAAVESKTITRAEWEEEGGQAKPEAGEYADTKAGCRLFVRAEGSVYRVLEIGTPLSAKEKELLRWALLQRTGRTSSGGSDVERQSRKLGDWIDGCLQSGDWRAEIPVRLELASRLTEGMIPILLHYEQPDEREIGFSELLKTIRSFLTEDVLLVPTRDQEWLVLAPDRLFSEMDGGTPDDDAVSASEVKDWLASLAEGLQQMIVSEWGGDCHVSIDEPILPRDEIVHTTGKLRETIALGRQFHVGQQVHLPWLIHLERLLSHVPETVLQRIAAEMAGPADLFSDAETVSTLELFFSLDCNVSETAKKLFIHRNTLLYRLDKFKQESGLDARSFNDAVRVRMMLLLYKFTKRK